MYQPPPRRKRSPCAAAPPPRLATPPGLRRVPSGCGRTPTRPSPADRLEHGPASARAPPARRRDRGSGHPRRHGPRCRDLRWRAQRRWPPGGPKPRRWRARPGEPPAIRRPHPPAAPRVGVTARRARRRGLRSAVPPPVPPPPVPCAPVPPPRRSSRRGVVSRGGARDALGTEHAAESGHEHCQLLQCWLGSSSAHNRSISVSAETDRPSWRARALRSRRRFLCATARPGSRCWSGWPTASDRDQLHRTGPGVLLGSSAQAVTGVSGGQARHERHQTTFSAKSSTRGMTSSVVGLDLGEYLPQTSQEGWEEVGGCRVEDLEVD